MGLAIDYALCDEFLLVKQMLHQCEKRLLYFESNFLDMEYVEMIWSSFINTAMWIWRSITFQEPIFQNYFWGVVAISLIVWALEVIFPWRKNQNVIRRDFWIDLGYMFFNFFGFSLIITGGYNVIELAFKNAGFSMNTIALFELSNWPLWSQLLVFFVILDFVQWLTHIFLHRVPVFWQFHKVHHSVIEMGFAAHMRYHWMENLLYKPLKTLVIMTLGGFEPQNAIIIHFVAITIGHLNHANINLTWGPFRYIFNNPVMHLWHHAKDLPLDRHYGVNFGISLSVWDYLFGTSHVPKVVDENMQLGFDGIEDFPREFKNQLFFGFSKQKRHKKSSN
jgi:sterol desaturase/sphingolipid hydroxylase (fatty acid hydroxylase superfamily)